MSPVLGIVLLLLGLAVGAAIGFLIRQRQDTALLVRAQAEADALRRSSQDEASVSRSVEVAVSAGSSKLVAALALYPHEVCQYSLLYALY